MDGFLESLILLPVEVDECITYLLESHGDWVRRHNAEEQSLLKRVDVRGPVSNIFGFREVRGASFLQKPDVRRADRKQGGGFVHDSTKVVMPLATLLTLEALRISPTHGPAGDSWAYDTRDDDSGD
jgi:hypothetical protein